MVADVLSDLRRRCEDAHPHEACGLLLGREEGGRRVVLDLFPARNADAARPRDRYALDPADFAAADERAARNGQDILGVYHSHPDATSEPSATDLLRAEPGWSYVVVGVAGPRGAARATRERSWTLASGDAGRSFVEEALRTD